MDQEKLAKGIFKWMLPVLAASFLVRYDRSMPDETKGVDKPAPTEQSPPKRDSTDGERKEAARLAHIQAAEARIRKNAQDYLEVSNIFTARQFAVSVAAYEKEIKKLEAAECRRRLTDNEIDILIIDQEQLGYSKLAGDPSRVEKAKNDLIAALYDSTKNHDGFLGAGDLFTPSVAGAIMQYDSGKILYYLGQ